MVRTVPVYPGDGYHYTSSLSQTDESDQFSLSPLRMILSKETINLGAPYCRYILICCSLHSPEQRNLLVINLNVIPLLLLNWQDQSLSSQLWRLDLSLKTVTGLWLAVSVWGQLQSVGLVRAVVRILFLLELHHVKIWFMAAGKLFFFIKIFSVRTNYTEF